MKAVVSILARVELPASEHPCLAAQGRRRTPEARASRRPCWRREGTQGDSPRGAFQPRERCARIEEVLFWEFLDFLESE
jgi:hypothetical protein